jgi:hypothetical protein
MVRIGKATLLQGITLGLLVAFIIDLAHLRVVWGILFFALAIMRYQQQKTRLNSDQWTDRWLLLSLLVSFILFLAISPLGLATQTLWFRIFEISVIVLVFLGTNLLSFVNAFSFKQFYGTVLIALSVVLVFSGIATLIQYGPFYRLIYAGQVIYVEGEQYALTQEFLLWHGWGWITTRMDALQGWLILGLLPLLKRTLFQDKITWLEWVPLIVSFTMIGFLTYWAPLIYVGLIVLFWGFASWLNRYPAKTQKRILFGLLALVILGVSIGILDTFNVFGIGDVLASTPVNMVLNHPFVNRYQAIIFYVSQHVFGAYGQLIFQNQFVEATGSFFFDVVYQGGWLSFISLLVWMIFVPLFIHKASMSNFEKRVGYTVLLAIYLPWLFQYPLFPYVREVNERTSLLLFTHPLLMMSLILAAMVAQDPFNVFKKV